MYSKSINFLFEVLFRKFIIECTSLLLIYYISYLHIMADTGKSKLDLVGRGLLSKIVQFRCTHLGNTWFVVYLKDI